MENDFEELYVTKGDSQVGGFQPDSVGSDIGNIVEAQLEAGADEQVRVTGIFAYAGQNPVRVELNSKRPGDTAAYEIVTKDWFGQQKTTLVMLKEDQYQL
ncbi:hypothetical protein KY363_00990 [Candidatus Woesearchaeota archaeon]|nr:hypothetical protein [Candidatus Woesearchaeota archaeon]